MAFLDERSKINFVCMMTTDRGSLEAAKWLRMPMSGRAWEHLNYFLSARGGIKQVDLQQLIGDNPHIRVILIGSIREGLKNKQNSGRQLIRQKNYNIETRAGDDWRLAVGGMYIDWFISPEDKNMVQLSFTDIYDWHPEQDRFTKCLHVAATRLEHEGKARKFLMTGKATMSMDEVLNPKIAPVDFNSNYKPLSDRL